MVNKRILRNSKLINTYQNNKHDLFKISEGQIVRINV